MNFDHHIKNLFLSRKDENIKAIFSGTKTTAGEKSDEQAIVYFVEKKIDEKEIQPEKIIPKTLEIDGKQYKTDVVEASFELIDCYDYSANQKISDYAWCFNPAGCQATADSQLEHRKKTRPLIGGISIGNATISGNKNVGGGYGSAGTLGLIARDKTDNCAVGVTCAHVVCSDFFISNEKANVNNTTEQIVSQPAYLDCPGDICTDTSIGQIKRYSPSSSNPDYENYIDCALISINKDLLDESSFGQLGLSLQELDWATEEECNNLISSNISLYKSGRTTGLLGGNECPIVAIGLNGSVQIPQFGQYKFSYITYQESITFRYANSSAGVAVGGDSGSALIGDFDGIKKVVGIVYAASTNTVYGVAYPIYKLKEIMDVEPLNQNAIKYSDPRNWNYKTFDSDEPFIFVDGKKYWQVGTAITSNTNKLDYKKIVSSSTGTYKIKRFIDSNSANFSILNVYGGQVFNSITTNGFSNYVQTVGTNGAPSYYGTYDQSGNVFEWIDSYEPSSDDVGTIAIKQRGGSFASFFEEIGKDYYKLADGASDNYPVSLPPSGERIKGGPALDVGFRLSSKNDPLNYSFTINEITNNFVNVQDISNVADPDTGLGSVSYDYKIMKYTVTNQEYVEFLNATDPEGNNLRKTYHVGMTYGIANQDSDSLLTNSSKEGGINFIENNSYGNKYKVKFNMANKPVIYVGWYSAARFANWLHNKVDNPNSTETETGAYDLNGSYYNGSSNPPEANMDARYRIPTEDEWYKAAYFDPVKVVYRNYATQNDLIPQKAFTNLYIYRYKWGFDVNAYSEQSLSGNGDQLFYSYIFYSSYYPRYNTGISKIKGVEDLINSYENDAGTGAEIISSSDNSLLHFLSPINCFNKNRSIQIYMNEDASPIAIINYTQSLETTGFGPNGISGVNLKNASKNEFKFITIKDGIKIAYDSFFNNQTLHFLNWSQDFPSIEILPKQINYNRSANVKSTFGNWGLLRSVTNSNVWNS